MKYPIARSKIIVPRRGSDLLTRERLISQIYALLEQKLIIVSAPAGYGKTSLMVDVAHHTELPVCWYALDSLDRDTPRFLAHFVASITRQFSGFGQQSESALQNALQGEFDLGRLVTVIANEVFENIQEHFVIVLDDYHLIENNHDIARFLNYFIQYVDENCHLVLISRTIPSLPDLDLLVAYSQVEGLNDEVLAFRAEEIKALIGQNYQQEISDSLAEQLERETEGWITGLLLSAKSMWADLQNRYRLARGSDEGVYDYLARQVFEQQPEKLQIFLLRTSLLEEFDAQLYKAALGPLSEGYTWEEQMDSVLKNNLFIQAVGDQGDWLRYHHLFRDFLQTRMLRERPGESQQILSRLAAFYAKREEWEQAYHIYAHRLEDEAAILDLINQARHSLAQNGRWNLLAAWLDALPAGVFGERPTLQSLRGIVAVMLNDMDRGLALLDQAEKSQRKLGITTDLASTLARRATAYRIIGRYQDSLRDSKEGLTLVQNDEEAKIVQAEALRAKGLSLKRLGSLQEAIECLQEARAIYLSLGIAANVALVEIDLGIIYRSLGNFLRARKCYSDSLSYWRQVNDFVRQASVLNNLGVLAHFMGDYEKAVDLLEEAVTCAVKSGHERMQAYALSSIGDIYLDLEAPAAALDAYEQARSLAAEIENLFLLGYIDVVEARVARMHGNFRQAQDLLDSAHRIAKETGSDYELGLWKLAMAQFLMDRGKVQDAIAHLESAEENFEAGEQMIEAARTHLFLASAHYRVGRKDLAITQLSRAFEIADNLDDQHALIVDSRWVKDVVKKVGARNDANGRAFQFGERIERFEKEIVHLRKRLREKVSVVPFAPPKIVVKSLGVNQVIVNDQMVTGAQWRSYMARDLFFLLIAHPEGLTKERIGAFLWPEYDNERLKIIFKKTIYRLRRALELEVVVFDGDRYRFNRALDYEYDAENFEKWFKAADSTEDPGEKEAAYWAMLELNWGPFLPDVDGSWVQVERQRLQQMYEDAALKLAHRLFEKQQFNESLDVCRRLLRNEPLLEPVHRLIMCAHSALGNQTELVHQYDQLRQSLMDELGIPPSPQTRALYEKLIA